MEEKQQCLRLPEIANNRPKLLGDQLLATKFFVPVAPGTLISRPRLTALLDQSLVYPLTLISAPAGFGKTTLLSTWIQLLSGNAPKPVWLSLDEEDNEPQLFWTYVLAALNRQQPERFTSLLMQMQSPQPPPLKYVLIALINLLVNGTEHFLLILDDYHLITEQQVHTALSYLIEHLPAQLHIILSTRTDPPLPLAQLRIRQHLLEVRTDQLRSTAEETKTFFKEIIGIQLPEKAIQEVTIRTEGWLVGLHLLGLSLPAHADPTALLEGISGDQRYILDYLTQEVLCQQPEDVQTFLLFTSILEGFTASLCDTVTQRPGSHQMFHRLERANLFIVSLDSRCQWYRYHALFAQALRYQLENIYPEIIPILHSRASKWYAEHGQLTNAILHAFSAHQWELAADLIERSSPMSFTWGAGEGELLLLRRWLERLPSEVVHARPRLCLACAQLLWAVAPYAKLETWLSSAEARLSASLREPLVDALSPHQERDKQANLLGEVIAFGAFLQSDLEDGAAILERCQQALSLLSADNLMVRALVASTQLRAFYASSVNDVVMAVESGRQAYTLAQAAGLRTLAISLMGTTALFMMGTGQLQEIQQLTQRAIGLGTKQGELMLPEVGWPALLQAELQREWNQLDAALVQAQEAIDLCKQTTSLASFVYTLYGYAILLRIYLSRGEREAARSTFQQLEQIGTQMNLPTFINLRSYFTTIDQVRLWLADGQMEQAKHWTEMLDITMRQGTPFAHEREEVACVRVLLATCLPTEALQRLEPVLQRAATGQRWGHVIEIHLLQAVAHHMLHQQPQALDALSQAIRLAEPQGYIRSFVEEGTPIEALLYVLRSRFYKQRSTPYLDTLLAAFQQESEVHRQTGNLTKVQPLPEPLSKREIEVLHLINAGASNQEIAQELVIAYDTVKRHVSNVFSKLGASNRVQAVKQAKMLGLLDEEQ